MSYTQSELHAIIKNGENSAVEFKTAVVRPESIAKMGFVDVPDPALLCDVVGGLF